MREHLLESETFLPHPRETVFAFFAEAKNLGELTPATLGFEILPPEPSRMDEGALIDYRIRLRGWPMRWRTIIRDWKPPFEFTDEQLRGPYRRWVHRHVFEETEGGTWVRDHVRYALPFFPFGELVHPFVRAELRQIFAFRKTAMERIFAGSV
jgi:ligand-binding SRPBCC domain-containing protein